MNTRLTKLFKQFLLLFSAIFLLISNHQVLAQDGEKLFKANCASCHKLTDQKLTGPGLAGVMNRVPSEEWLHKWIKNSAELIKSGDSYANKIYSEYKTPMTAFTYLKDEEINAIIAYIKAPPAEKGTAPVAQAPGEVNQPVDTGNSSLTILISVIVLLIILITVFAKVRRNLKNVLNQKQGLPAEASKTFWEETKDWMGAHKRFVALCIIILVSLGAKDTWDAMMGIGVYQGYKPTQPIKFSHKIHAGDNKINCVYCHNTAEKSKTSGIPTVNVCMNCHKGIDKGPVTGTTEIAKIYEAAGWDPSAQKYSKPQKPIKWVKVHNLPDFVFFSHQQHVVVGKQECTTCHGDIATMDVAQQHSPMTMAWCIDCHRTTNVAMEGNPYYEELHKKLAAKYKNQKITVEQMGGIECGKCHY